MKNELRHDLQSFVDELNERLGNSGRQQNLSWNPSWTETFRAFSNDDRIAVWSALTAACNENVDKSIIIWKNLMPLVLDVFGVKPGEAGVGMIPKIPGAT